MLPLVNSLKRQRWHYQDCCDIFTDYSSGWKHGEDAISLDNFEAISYLYSIRAARHHISSKSQNRHETRQYDAYDCFY